jgi:hypothetical protein
MTTTNAESGRPREGGPTSLDELVEVLTNLPADPVERIRVLKQLTQVAPVLLADEAARITRQVTDRTNATYIIPADLARRLDVHPNKITEALRRAERLTRG